MYVPQKEEKIRLLKVKLQEREAMRATAADGTAPSAAEGMSEPARNNFARNSHEPAITGLILPDALTTNSDSAIGPISGYTRSSQSDVDFSESYL